MEISEITKKGLVTVKFLEEILPVAKTEINSEILKLDIVASDQTFVSQLLFVWKIVDITTTEM